MLVALDLFCKAGGAARGLAEAGFEVVGVDVERQDNYPYQFHQADALTCSPEWVRGFDLVWASPPCLDNTSLRSAPNAKRHKDLIAPTRKLLQKSGVKRWVIENVDSPRARERLRNPVRLCGSMFDLGCIHEETWYALRRHRLFESNFPIRGFCRHEDHPVIGIYGTHIRNRSRKYGGRRTKDFDNADKPALAAEALGLPPGCMTMDEYSNAIPPAFAAHIARAALRA